MKYMSKLVILIVYITKPDIRYGIGGVRKFLTLFSSFAISRSIKIQYCTMFSKPLNFGFLNPACNFIFAIRLLIVLLRFHKDSGVRYVLYVHDAFYSGFVAILASKIKKMPVILHYHNSPSLCFLSASSNTFLARIGYVIIHLVEKYVLKHSHAIIVTNYTLKKLICRLGVVEKRITVLPMPVPLRNLQVGFDRFSVCCKLNIPSNSFIIGYVGRLSSEKNLDILIKAFSMLMEETGDSNMRCILVGDGLERRRLEDLVAKLKLNDFVVFMGFRLDIPLILNVLDVFVLPSKTEGSPLALIEAMAAGKCIVASNIPAIREIVENGRDALLFNPSSPEQLKKVLLTLRNNPLLRRMLIENARRKAEQYDVNVILPKIISICMGVDTYS